MRIVLLDKNGNAIDDTMNAEYKPRCEGVRFEKPAEKVNHPGYYKRGGIEAIDVIEAWGLGFNLGNVVKYIARAGRKTDDRLQDLRKAAWYLDREIKRRERE